MQISAAGTDHRLFTLVELGVVLLLMALMLALVAPRAGRIPRAVAVRSLLGTVESAFRDAGLRARASGEAVRLRADPSANCLRIVSGSAGTSGVETADDEGEGAGPASVRQRYEFPGKTEWRIDEALGDTVEDLPDFVFYPGGEAGGPDLQIRLRKQTFLISIDRLTGRPIITEKDDPWAGWP